MKIQFFAVTLLSQLALSTPVATVWAAPDVVIKTLPVLTVEDKTFLGMKMGLQFDFPTDAKDKVVNQAAFFMNDVKFIEGMTYQMMFDKLVQEDNALSKDKMIPGAFMDAAADLYEFAADDIIAADFPNLSSAEQVDRIKREQKNFRDFADILRKEARILGSQQIPVAEAIVKLRIQLEEAKKIGKPYKKVYVYSDADNYRDDYYRLRDDYPGLDIVFRVFDPDINIFFRDLDVIDDGYVYIDRIPVYYEPLYSYIWYPFYSRFYEDNSYFLGFGYPYAVDNYWYGYYGGYAPGYWGGWDNWRSRRFGDRDWHEHHRGDYKRNHDQNRKDFDKDRQDRHRGEMIAGVGAGLAVGALAGAVIGRHHAGKGDRVTQGDQVGRHENVGKHDATAKVDRVAKGDKVPKHDSATKADRVAKGDKVRKHDATTKADRVAKGDKVRKNDAMAKADRVAKGDKIRKHDATVKDPVKKRDKVVKRDAAPKADHVDRVDRTRSKAGQGTGKAGLQGDHGKASGGNRVAKAPSGGGGGHVAKAPSGGGGGNRVAKAPSGGGGSHAAGGGGGGHAAKASSGGGGGGGNQR